MSELILHHYDFSTFSEKIRLVLGLKRLAWRSVAVPAFLPKPDLVALTGGYRNVPVLQIGADVYCDTRLIAAEIERRYPDPPLWQAQSAGLAHAIEAWAERDLFWPIARYVTGRNAENIDPRLHADRAALRGKPAPSLAAVKAAAERSLPAMRIEIPRVANMLSDGRPFLLGAAPGIADFAAYHGFWFMAAFPIDCSGEIAPYPLIRAWMTRVAAIGHGLPGPMAAGDALAIARQSTAAKPSTADIDTDGPPLGSRVSVRPEDYATAAVEGELAMLRRNEVALRLDKPPTGVVAHFPRLGYVVKSLSQDMSRSL